MKGSLSLFDEPGTPIELGLTVDHRRLFSAIADGWLRPLEGSAGQTLGVVSRFVRERVPATSGHRIAVRLTLDAGKLPDLDAFVHRNGDWAPARLQAISRSDDLVHWPGAIPAFAISSLAVVSAEAKARLDGLSRTVSNVDLSAMPVTVANVAEDAVPSCTPPREESAKIEIPPDLNAVHGALAMAVWAVPRIDPWLDVLQASLGADPSKLRDATAALNAAWWRLPPWQPPSERPNTLADCLWLATSEAFRSDCNERQSARPRDLLARVAELAEAHGDRCVDAVAAWKTCTERILATEATVQLEGWRENPVGLAIQLVLTRPEPDRFKSWFKDMPDLPPGVAWSAATLCGLLNGYKKLAADFRGRPLQRELLAVKALSLCSPQSPNVSWPNGPLDLRWRRDGAKFMLSHEGQDFACKAQNARGGWYAADLESTDNRRTARRIAEELAFPCLAATMRKGEQVPYSGPGKLSLRNGHLEAEGEVTLHVVSAKFDPDSFRRCVATERGKLPPPPVVDAQPRPHVPGLVYRPNFLEKEHERRLVEWIDAQEWSDELKRRVQHYGWRYEYKGRKVDSSLRLGDLPPELLELAQRLYDSKLVPQMPDQVIVNEYKAKARQGISTHVDEKSSFADGIATISLLESWEMNFHAPGRKGTKRTVVPWLLERGSVAIMKGDARWKWKHEIRNRKSDPPLTGTGKRRPRNRRISLTFRKVLPKPAR